MGEIIQAKIYEEDIRKAKNPRLKRCLGAYDIRVQEGGVPINKKYYGTTESRYTPASALLTISGTQLGTKADITKTLNQFGIEVIAIGSKIPI